MAATTKPKTTRKRRSKAETQEEFDLIREEVLESNSNANAKLNEMLKLQEKVICESVRDLSAEDIFRKISELNGDISKTLSVLSDKMISELNILADLREAIDIKTKELETLHKIDVAQTALDQLVESYQQQSEELDNEIQTTRIEWEQEEEEKKKELKELEEARKKSRQQEAEEYDYKKNLERKKTQDKYEEEIRLRDKQNREQQENLEKSWQQREQGLRERETELANLRQAVEEFPVKIKKEVEKGTSDAIKATEQKLSQEILLLKRDSTSEAKMAELRIQTLEETIARQSSQIQALQSQVEEAKKQVQDIAVKAIEGASGAKALTHINQIAMEQAKTRTAST